MPYKKPAKPKKSKEYKILDTSGILRSDMNFSEGRFYITNSVLQELQDETARSAIDSGINSENIKIIDPGSAYVQRIKEVAKDTGDLAKLSDTDIDILALALDKNIPLITDDYNIQNVASYLNLKYETVTHEGIEKKLKWIKFCPACKTEYANDDTVTTCKICGTKLNKKSVD